MIVKEVSGDVSVKYSIIAVDRRCFNQYTGKDYRQGFRVRILVG